MTKPYRLALLLAALLLPGLLATAATPEASATAQQKCCFNNPRFTGTCEVIPTGDETCSSILGYLNNPNSVGKAYCGNTKVRGGWAEVSCEGAASVATGGCHQPDLDPGTDPPAGAQSDS